MTEREQLAKEKMIQLTQGYIALVDACDYNKLKDYSWSAIVDKKYGTVYARRGTKVNGKTKTTYMHRDILMPPKWYQIDHINGNGLDNRRDNLRLVDQSANQHNRHVNPKYKYFGVYKTASQRKWSAHISIRGKPTYLGTFDTEEEAYKCYMKHKRPLMP